MSEELRVVGMDFDGTLFVNDWTPENPHASIGKPIERNLLKLRDLIAAGYEIVIYTARHWGDYDDIYAALIQQGIRPKAVVCGKLLACAYVDDRAVHADEPDWLYHVEHINGRGD